MSSSGPARIELLPGWVQVWFHMSGGPAAALGVSAEVVPPDQVRLSSAPWAALNAARGDVFRVQRDTDRQLWVQDKVKASGYCAIRIVLADDSPLGPLTGGGRAILDKFVALGVTGSGMFGLVVIDVPPDADLYLVRRLLDTGQRDGWWVWTLT